MARSATVRGLLTWGAILTRYALAWWFPSVCIECQTPVFPYEMICKTCRYRVPRVSMPVCIKCGKPLVASGVDIHYRGLCPQCLLRPLVLDGVRAWALMDEPVRRWIHTMKYRGAARVADRLATWMAQDMEDWIRVMGIEAITFVPLHPRRYRERGYNQAKRLARRLAQRWQLPCVVTLRRVQYEGPQVGRSGSERWENVQQAFTAIHPRIGRRFSVWLIVDDVYTTGATLHACTPVLKRAGARHVYGLCIATTPAVDL